jgi:hypothetical protein
VPEKIPMKTQEIAKAKPAARTIPSAAERDAAFAKLTQKDRDNFERQITNVTTKVGENLANHWRRLAGTALALSNKPPKLTGLNTLQFFIADGNYRKQIYAMHLADTGVLTMYVPNIFPEATKAKLLTPLPKDPTPDAYTVGGHRVIIEQLDRDSLNPQFYFKDMTGWNRKAMGIQLTVDANEGLVHAVEQILALAATWPAAAPDPVK